MSLDQLNGLVLLRQKFSCLAIFASLLSQLVIQGSLHPEACVLVGHCFAAVFRSLAFRSEVPTLQGSLRRHFLLETLMHQLLEIAAHLSEVLVLELEHIDSLQGHV